MPVPVQLRSRTKVAIHLPCNFHAGTTEPMTTAGSTCYLMREPFHRAVSAIRKLLESRGLRIAGQLDVSRRVENSLGIVLAPCRVILVLPDPSVSRRSRMHHSVAGFLPLHVVVSGHGSQTEIHLRNRVPVVPGAADVLVSILETQAQIASAIESVAMRPSLIA
jgi:uncharacterized protein (DUF302 family)